MKSFSWWFRASQALIPPPPLRASPQALVQLDRRLLDLPECIQKQILNIAVDLILIVLFLLVIVLLRFIVITFIFINKLLKLCIQFCFRILYQAVPFTIMKRIICRRISRGPCPTQAILVNDRDALLAGLDNSAS